MDLSIVIILILVVRSNANKIETHQINPDSGFVIYKMEPDAVVDKYFKVLHIVDLKIFMNCLQKTEENLVKLNLVDKSDIDLIKREIQLANTTLSTLIPHAFKGDRSKRGLINIGGSLLKMVWGTMDDEDAMEIYGHLAALDNNSKQMTDQMNKQVEINNNLIKNLDTVVDSVNKQQNKLNEFLSNITTRTNKALDLVEKFRFVLQTYADLNILNRQIEKISDVVMMSKQNILPHDILTEAEKIRYNITVETLPYLKTNIMFFENKLVFVLQIPRFTKETYFKALIIPFPNEHYEELESPIEEVLMQGEMVYKNSEQILVKKNLLVHSNKCVRDSFKQNNDCNLKINKESIIKEIKAGLVITKLIEFTKVDHDCNDQPYFVKGNSIIKFDNCTIKIKEFVFENLFDRFNHGVLIPLNYVNFTKIVNNFTLEELHLQNIKNREIIKYIEYKSNITQGTTISLIVLLLIVILFLIIKIKCCKVRKNKIELKLSEHPDPFARRANTKGGEITYM